MAGPAAQVAAKPPSQPAGPPAPTSTPWQSILWKNNDKFIKKLFVGKFTGTDVKRFGYFRLPRETEPTTLKNLAQICKEGPALSKQSPARNITFDRIGYVVRKKDPQTCKEKGLKLAFVGAIPSRFPGMGHKIIYAFLTEEDYLFLGFGPTTKEAIDADPDETPMRLKRLISNLRKAGHLQKHK
ncbi:hypothetical protein VMCG_01905 [Cytospora schulzeri]|uniref:Uncharacterized protein n=1 Tax=Cytospora schulzeri TaxID=448051 RepID=A0A423X3E1_9PEZI|nr:hypothetical protein VMCG_01905 [Valsa malicola]